MSGACLSSSNANFMNPLLVYTAGSRLDLTSFASHTLPYPTIFMLAHFLLTFLCSFTCYYSHLVAPLFFSVSHSFCWVFILCIEAASTSFNLPWPSYLGNTNLNVPNNVPHSLLPTKQPLLIWAYVYKSRSLSFIWQSSAINSLFQSSSKTGTSLALICFNKFLLIYLALIWLSSCNYFKAVNLALANPHTYGNSSCKPNICQAIHKYYC